MADGPRRKLVGIDLTPLVDVVFLLLIFFMVSTTFRQDEGLELRLPQAASAEPRANDEDLRVQLGRDGRIRFKGRDVDISGLEAAARAALESSSQRQVVVEADAQAAHGQVVTIMDALRRAGARGLTVATAGEAAP